MLRPGRKLASLLVSRIKVMARLDDTSACRRMDVLRCCWSGRAIDVRVSTMPSARAKGVVRLLDKTGPA